MSSSLMECLGLRRGCMSKDYMAEIDRLKEIVETLRSENGCPWDRKQTHMSLKPECIEEARELMKFLDLEDAK